MRRIVNFAQSHGVGLRDKSGPGHPDRLPAVRAMPCIGTGQAEIVTRTRALLDDSAKYDTMEASATMAHAVNPYGDGHAGRFGY
jgi:hypothetical protein